MPAYASMPLCLKLDYNIFFHAPNETQDGDLIFYQGHASPGIYARAFLEGRLEAEHLDHFRQEIFNKKRFFLSSSLVNAAFLAIPVGFYGLRAVNGNLSSSIS